MGKYRVQVNAQATVYEKTGRKVMEKTMVAGLVVPNQIDEEKEYECKQLAVAFSGTTINEKELDEKLRQLAEGIKQSMIQKGLVI